jgi:predicted lipoprotein
MRIISLTGAVVAVAAVLSLAATAGAEAPRAAHTPVAASAAQLPAGGSVSHHGNDPWD